MTLVPVEPGATISLALEAPAGSWSLPAFTGVVRTVQPIEAERQFRVSVAFEGLALEAASALEGLLATLDAEAAPTVTDEVARLLRQATLHLERADRLGAGRAVHELLAIDADHLPARILKHRLDAEAALERGAYAQASREVALGLVRGPRDPGLERLRQKLDGMRDAWMRRQKA